MTATPTDKNILFFDGDCALCSFWVQFCMERDRRKVLFYAPLQGTTATEMLPEELRTDLRTIVFWPQGGPSALRSEAILGALKLIGYSPDVVWVAKLIPTKFRNQMYDFIASRRMKWFGKKDFCPVVPEQYRTQLLN